MKLSSIFETTSFKLTALYLGLFLGSFLAIGLAVYGGLHWLARTKETQFIEAFIVPKAVQFFAAKRFFVML